MSKGRILVVDDEQDIANMLKIYFTGQGYDVEVANRGSDALDITQKQLPQLIVLDINLPDTDGYTLFKQMRTQTRTKHIPVIFLTEKDDRSARIAGLELGADDYITKPFDIEELRLRISNSITSAERMGLTDPRSGLPSGRLIEDALRGLLRRKAWAYMDMRVNWFEPFKDKYGFVAGDEVLRFTAMLISEIVDASGSPDDFIGHAGGDNFVLITEPEVSENIKSTIEKRFNEEVKGHYSYVDREKGGMNMVDGYGEERHIPLMSVSIGMVDSKRDFSDIREITEAAAEERRKAQQATRPGSPSASASPTSAGPSTPSASPSPGAGPSTPSASPSPSTPSASPSTSAPSTGTSTSSSTNPPPAPASPPKKT